MFVLCFVFLHVGVYGYVARPDFPEEAVCL